MVVEDDARVQIAVDAETGLLLQRRDDRCPGLVEEWTEFVFDHEEATGAFTVGLGPIGTLARRPQSSKRWKPGPGTHHRWRADGFD